MKLPGGSAVALVALLVATSAIAPAVVARPAGQSAPDAKPNGGDTPPSITADPPASASVGPSVSTASVRSENTPVAEGAADDTIHQQTTLSFSVRFETPGIRTLRAQDQRVAVTVRDPTVTAANGSLPILLSVLAVLFALVLARRHEQS
jgi:hypothetical protein